jgi:hypothetical protein
MDLLRRHLPDNKSHKKPVKNNQMAQTREQNSCESGYLCGERDHLQSGNADQTGSVTDGNPSCDKIAGHSDR